jgi:DNA-binding PadR family transcriptional regulator
MKMSLPHALLGLLNYRPATGYDLKATFEKSINLFWNASLPQIYRTLNQMEKKDWLSFKVEHQDGKPSRKIYNLTDAGKKELQKWLSKPPELPEIKNNMLVKIFFGNRMDKKDLTVNLRKWRERYIKLLEKLGPELKSAVDNYATKVDSRDDMPFWILTADYGRRYAKMVIEWCDTALDVVEKGKKIKLSDNRTVKSQRTNKK